MSRSRPLLGGAAVALALVAAPAADAASVEAFRAFASDGAIEYRIVLCAPVRSKVVFTTRLEARRGPAYVLPPRSGRQQHACPTWRYAESNRFPPGRYTTQVGIEVDGDRLRTPRVVVVLPSGKRTAGRP